MASSVRDAVVGLMRERLAVLVTETQEIMGMLAAMGVRSAAGVPVGRRVPIVGANPAPERLVIRRDAEPGRKGKRLKRATVRGILADHKAGRDAGDIAKRRAVPVGKVAGVINRAALKRAKGRGGRK